jgi:hypothetical protein
MIVLVALVLLAAIVHGTLSLVRKQVPARWTYLLLGLRLAAWTVFLFALLQPVIAWTRHDAPRPTIAVLVDNSKSMQPHTEEIRELLRRGDLAASLEQRFRPQWFLFDDKARPTTPSEVAALPADGVGTRIAAALAGAQQLLRAENIVFRRVLLVSDGLDRAGEDAVVAARRLGLAVDVLAPKGKQAPSNSTVEIADVQGARRVLLGSETHFRVTLRRGQTASRDQKVTIRMLEDGMATSDIPIVVDKDALEKTVTLAHRPATTGIKQYEFVLPEMNSKPSPCVVQVVDSKFEILILEDTWRWEYKFLHRLFEDDPSFRFTALLARGGGAFTQFGSPDRRVNTVGFPQSRSDLEGFDLFFLGDVDPARWPPRLVSGLAHLIEEEGKSLVVIAGPQLARIAQVPELHALLPVEIVAASSKPLAGPIPVRLRSDAATSPFFFQLSAEQIDLLPPLDQIYPPLRKRPGATVLVEAAKHRNLYGPCVAVAEHTVGRGRVLFIGTDTLWKWHTLAPAKEGPTPYSLFWQQALRALTPERSHLGTVDVWLRASRTRPEPGQSVEVTAEVQSEIPLTRIKLDSNVVLPDGQRFPLALSADSQDLRKYRAVFAAPRAGNYTVAATASVDGQRAAEGSMSLHVVEPREEETDGRVDLAYLERLAKSTGGRLIDPSRPDTWPTAENGNEPPQIQTRTVALWDNFTLLLLLCFFLGADWFFRLMRGLV